MKTKRIVISGGPGTGKTSLIQYIADKGYPCMPEISREITLAAQREGISQLFLEDPILFSEKLLEGRLDQYQEGQKFDSPYLFYDRGMPDVTAYMDYLGTSYSSPFNHTCSEHKYDAIFLLPPWESIYQQDNERYESFAEATKIHQFLQESYSNYGYQVYEVPFGALEDRASFIFGKLNQLF